MGRALKIFLILVVAWGAIDFVFRAIFHLDCVGPDFPGVGCVSNFYPSASTQGQSLSIELLRAVVLLGIAFGLVYIVSGWFLRWIAPVIRQVLPGWLETYEDQQRENSTRYRLR